MAFVGLLGRSGQLTDAEMDAYTAFILRVQLPPNPIRNLDGSDHARRRPRAATFFNGPHLRHAEELQRLPHARTRRSGFFGTGGLSTFEGESQHFKVPHLRNAYQKVGTFGMLAVQRASRRTAIRTRRRSAASATCTTARSTT